MRCPECTFELELIKYRFYRCNRCEWLGVILSPQDALFSASVLQPGQSLSTMEKKIIDYYEDPSTSV